MGLFDKLFGKGRSNGNTTGLTKTAQLLDEDLYWQIIKESLDNTSDQEEQHMYLLKRLRKLTPTEIIGFKLRTDELSNTTYTSELWCAAYIINGGCSDDGFDYFRSWVISRGREVYYKAKENADTLVDVVDTEKEDGYEFEELDYVANDAFTNNTGEDIYDFIDEDNVPDSLDTNIEFTWEEEDPGTMKAICPKLFAKMWRE